LNLKNATPVLFSICCFNSSRVCKSISSAKMLPDSNPRSDIQNITGQTCVCWSILNEAQAHTVSVADHAVVLQIAKCAMLHVPFSGGTGNGANSTQSQQSPAPNDSGSASTTPATGSSSSSSNSLSSGAIAGITIGGVAALAAVVVGLALLARHRAGARGYGCAGASEEASGVLKASKGSVGGSGSEPAGRGAYSSGSMYPRAPVKQLPHLPGGSVAGKTVEDPHGMHAGSDTGAAAVAIIQPAAGGGGLGLGLGLPAAGGGAPTAAPTVAGSAAGYVTAANSVVSAITTKCIVRYGGMQPVGSQAAAALLAGGSSSAAAPGLEHSTGLPQPAAATGTGYATGAGRNAPQGSTAAANSGGGSAGPSTPLALMSSMGAGSRGGQTDAMGVMCPAGNGFAGIPAGGGGAVSGDFGSGTGGLAARTGTGTGGVPAAGLGTTAALTSNSYNTNNTNSGFPATAPQAAHLDVTSIMQVLVLPFGLQ
jgi:hypothetical protein